MNLTQTFLDFALLGAEWVLWLLIALSVASVAVMAERWLTYRSLANIDADLMQPVDEALADNDLRKAKQLVQKESSPGARLLRRMLQRASHGPKAAATVLEGSVGGERLRLEKRLSFLGTVGSNAPFIGLFGTVLEILRVFALMGEKGVTSGTQAQGIMTGISEALVATAVGLLVAIPAVVAYNAGNRRVKHLMSQANHLAHLALAHMERTDLKESN